MTPAMATPTFVDQTAPAYTSTASKCHNVVYVQNTAGCAAVVPRYDVPEAGEELGYSKASFKTALIFAGLAP